MLASRNGWWSSWERTRMGSASCKDEDRITILVRHKSLSRFGLSAGELDFFWKSHPFPTDELPKLQAELERLSPDSLTSRRDKLRAIRMRRLEAELSKQVYSEVTVKKRDIVAYRRERIAEAEFRKRIVSREHRPDASTMKKIGVMANILDKAMKQPEHPVPNSNKTLGIYQGRVRGALLCERAKRLPLPNIVEPYTKSSQDRHPIVAFERRKAVTAESQLPGSSSRKSWLRSWETTVIPCAPSSLRNTSWWRCAFSRDCGEEPRPERRGLILQVKKKDVDAYSRGDQDLATFRQKVDIREY